MKLKYAVKIAALKAVYTPLGVTTQPSASVTAGIFQVQRIKAAIQTLNRLVAEAQEGNFVLFASLFDSLNVQDGLGADDGAVIAFFKKFTDDAGIAEAATTDFTKALNDIGVFSDNELFAMVKSLTDNTGVSEGHSNDLQKPFSDQITSLEDETLVLTKKVKEDTAASSDQINTKGTSKPLADTSPVSDTHAATTSKPQSDNASTSDSEVFATSKALLDRVNVSDDVDGTASIEDDQEVAMFKQLTKVAQVSEHFTRQIGFTRGFTEQYTVSDLPSVGVSRPAADGITISADLFDAVLNKTTLENIALTETLVVDSAKILYDTSSAADLKSLRVSTPHSDTSATTDVAFRAPTKVLTELVPSTDAGSLRSQGYADFTYFAEDYVGASRTF